LNKIVEKGRTLLVDGPASVILKSGVAEVFGFHIKCGQKVVVRDGKRLPFSVEETADFELSLGRGVTIKEVVGNTVPQSWSQAYQTAVNMQQKPATIMVLGGGDSGKTSFCLYLTNRFVSNGFTVAVLDEDLGQSDIGPPCTVAYAYFTNPITDLFNAKPQSTVFVGATSPFGVTSRTVEAVSTLKTELVREAKADFVVVNTDGWATGEEAIDFKSQLASVLQPDVVFCLQGASTNLYCQAFEQALECFKLEKVESSEAIKERDFENRRDLRESGYARYFQNARVKVYTVKHIAVDETAVPVLFRGRQAENLLVGLINSEKRFLGIGVIRGIDSTRRAIKVFTCVDQRPAAVVFGGVRLDDNLREIPASPVTD
jgi:polynucleotide 5'-hydroxyl-kinase GRC3/NOL9